MKTTLDTIGSILLASLLAVSITTAASTAAAKGTAGISYTSGGAGPEGRAHMQRMESDYDLLIRFKAPGGANDYSGLRVSVVDETGKQVLNSAAGGPLFYAKVPPGGYRVAAEFHGAQATQSVTVAPRGATRLDFQLPN